MSVERMTDARRARGEAGDLLGLSDAELLGLAPDATHQHKKGGLYRMLGPVRSADDGRPVLFKLRGHEHRCGFYEHVYPYERQLWAREQAELDDVGRFRPLKRACDHEWCETDNWMIDRCARCGEERA